jgi:hypothetical protein
MLHMHLHQTSPPTTTSLMGNDARMTVSTDNVLSAIGTCHDLTGGERIDTIT